MIKTVTQTVRKTHFAKKLISMLALQLAFVFLVQVPGWGQGAFDPVQYNFQEPTKYTTAPNGSDISPTFSWMAGNGYGLWTCNTDDSWALLTNDFENKHISGTQIPQGVVASGTLLSTTGTGTRTKVATNLNGSCRYVTFQIQEVTNNPVFIVEGFNDQSFNSSFNDADKQIDISLSGIPKPNRNLITKPIFRYPDVAINIPLDPSSEFDWRDLFDIAMDAKYLYIVYETFQNNKYGIASIAIDLSSGQVVGRGGNSLGAEPFDPQYRRPTVACDTRVNPSLPTFEIGYIEWWTAPTDPNNPNTISFFPRQVMNETYINGQMQPIIGLPISHKRPKNPGLNDIQEIVPYSLPWHARILVSSFPGQITPSKSMYILMYSENPAPNWSGQDAGLIFHRFSVGAWEPFAYYCDGWRMKPLVPSHPEGGFAHCRNAPLIALANPYDGSHVHDDFQEWHCLYQLIDNGDNAILNVGLPLKIIRDHCNGLNGTPDTRTYLNFSQQQGWLQSDYGTPEYCATANQMGIHVHWPSAISTTALPHYNRRDLRRFDEDIEENTLLTNTCLVGDGSNTGPLHSGKHGGTQGATLLPEKRLTLWTDPYFNISSTNSGIYLPDPAHVYNHNAVLFINDDNTILNIGTSNSSGGANLVTLPNFIIQFNGQNQGLNINRNSVFDYYGYAYTKKILDHNYFTVDQTNNTDWTNYSHFIGTGSITLDGAAHEADLNNAYAPPINLTDPATLNIHGGANFRLPETITFSATNSIIDLKYDQSITPVFGVILNDQTTGRSFLQGPSTISWSEVFSHIPLTDVDNNNSDVFTILNGNVTPANTTGLTSTNTLYDNANTGSARFAITGFYYNASSQKICSFSGGAFEHFLIHVKDPQNAFSMNETVSNVNSNQPAISIHTGLSTSDNISTTNATIIANGSDETGISLSGFSTKRISSFDKILIDGNTISASNGSSNAGIYFEVTNGKLSGNTIHGFWDGIRVTGNANHNLNTFICSNIISSCANAGINTFDWRGIGRLNQVSDCAIGHLFTGDNLKAFVLYSTYSGNSGPGIKISSTTDNLVYLIEQNFTTGDFKGHNTISLNNTSRSTTTTQFEFDDASTTHHCILGNSCDNDANDGQNNIIKNADVGDYYAYANASSGGDLGQLYHNYWAKNTTPDEYIDRSDAFYNVDYSCIAYRETQYGFTNITCDDGFTESIKPKNKTMLLSLLQGIDCKRLDQEGSTYYNNFQFKMSYDTLKTYIENCYNDVLAYLNFGPISDAADGMSAVGDTVWASYRTWLIKVLHLNPDWTYYCADLMEYALAFCHKDELGHQIDFKTALAIYQYLGDSSKCVYLKKDAWKDLLNTYHMLWQDTVMDSIKTPFDTTLPSIDQIGQGFLRGFAGVHSSDGKNSISAISNMQAIKNPFTDETGITFTVNIPTVAKIEIYDELGKPVWSDGQGYLEVGKHEVRMNTSSWGSGTYFARILTLQGEVNTVKLVHEK